MSKTTETLQEQPAAITGILADLAAVTDRLVATVCAAGVVEVLSRGREQRRWVDVTLAADPERFRRLDAEDRVAAVADLVDQARPDLHRERERRATEREFVRWQKAFDGSSAHKASSR